MGDISSDIVASGAVRAPNLIQAFGPAMAGPDIGANLQRLRSEAVEEKSARFSPDMSRAIYIRGLGVTSAEDQKPVLGSIGAVPCVIVAVYNHDAKKGALGHFDVYTDRKSVDTMIEAVGKGRKIEVTLAGGELGSKPSHELVADILQKLSNYPNVVIKSEGLLDASGGLKSLALDTRDGRTYNRFFESDMDKGPRAAIMAHHAATALQKGPLRPEYIEGQSYAPDGSAPAPPAAGAKP